MKIMTVVGARPQFIKAAALSRILRKQHLELLVHTGQHFDDNMSEVFFRELDIPRPDVNLGISGGSHGQMTGRMLSAIEETIIAHKPDAMLVFGDTNSTMAAALAAVKLLVPVIHVEAGCRFGTLTNPEEVNRVVTDHVSSVRFASVESAMNALNRESLSHNSFLVGDPMYDAFAYYGAKAKATPHTLALLDGTAKTIPDEYYYMTCHRQENTDDPEKLRNILNAMNSLDAPVIYPVHPRNHATAAALMESGLFAHILFVQPVGYLTSIALICGAKKIVTDSGGVQREAFFAGVQCVTILDAVMWPETMVSYRNQLAHPDRDVILQRLASPMTVDPAYHPFGDGHSCEAICRHLDGITLAVE